MTTVAHIDRPGQAAVPLAADEIHVWSLPLRPDGIEQAGSPLSADERKRAARYLLPAERDRFTLGRGRLRRILAGYLDADPRALTFGANVHGKPHLSGQWFGSVEFNVSHSGGLVVIAVAKDPVGVDVEEIRPDVAHSEIAARFFSARERADLASLPAAARTRAFFDCWVRKEAYVKAKGLGFAVALESFSVSLLPTQSARLVASSGHPDDVDRWALHAFEPAPGYAAAVAAWGARRVRRFTIG